MSFSLKPKEIDYTVAPEQYPESELVAILDADWPKYTVASAGEKRTIKVTHLPSGKEILNKIKVENEKTGKEETTEVPFKTRTEFWGRTKAISGWLAEANKKAKKPATREDFLIEDIQTPEPIENVLHSAKTIVLGTLAALGTDNYEAYIGEGGSFRVGLSTLQEYKGQRGNVIKPLLLGDVSDYLKSRFDATNIKGIEVDDKVVMRAYKDPNAVVVGEDKDYYGQPVKFFNANRPDEGIINGDCFGKLWVQGTGSKEKIRGFGRLFLYWQICSEDKVDNYKANCHSEISWAGKSAYKALCECKNDKEALQVVIEIFKKLYPEPKQITTWQGLDITIDWYYVCNEMFQMARMLRWEGDLMSFAQWYAEYNTEAT